MTPRERAGAQAILAAVTGPEHGFTSRDVILDYADEHGNLDVAGQHLTAADVALGGAALFGRILSDVSRVLAISKAETLAAAGEWIETA